MTYDYSPPPPPPEPGSESESRDRPSGWHPVSIGHLVMGLVFLTFVTVWALIQTDVVDLRHDFRLLLPLPWIVGGAAGVVVAVLRNRR